MKPRFLASAFYILALALGTCPTQGQVQASLVSADSTVAPGQPFNVALHLVHSPGWHTYWLNPGTGLATSLKWTLPAGWTASAIHWPAPMVIKDRLGTVTGNGYTGDLLLPVTLTPPADAPAGTVKLTAAAAWLMCQNVCEPGDATVNLDVTVGPNPAADPTWSGPIESTMAKLPRSDATWEVTAVRHTNAVTLTVNPGPDAPAHATLTGLHFFSDDNLIGYDQPQPVVADSKGGFTLTLAVSPDGPTDEHELHGVLTSDHGFNADEPGLRVDLPFGNTAVAPSADAAPVAAGGVLGFLLAGFLGGLILNLMPCVFPVLGIKVLGFVNQAGADRRKVVMHGVMFTSGVLLSFWALAGILFVLRSGGAQLGWGFQLQSPAFVFLLAIVMLVFALNMSGVFEFGLSATAIGGNLQSREGLAGSFFTGILATLVATPCSAPFLAPSLGAALTLPSFEAFLVFTCIALGLSTPYLLFSIFPALVKFLPRPGAWMETFKQLMAFPLYAAAGWLLWVLAGQVPEFQQLYALFAMVLVAFGVWLYGRFHAAGASAGRARFGLIAGLAVGLAGLWLGWPVAPKPDAIVWTKWSPSEVARLRAEGRIVYVDFTARWCATCQTNKTIVFHSDDVLRAFRNKHVATLRGDWTSRDPAITAELEKYHRSAVPFNQVWVPSQPQPELLPEVLTPGVVLKAVSSG
ncbi:MAG TPA: protein-disulfide reductase DsbD domain-containing protein [Opitutaceae bacterium]